MGKAQSKNEESEKEIMTGLNRGWADTIEAEGLSNPAVTAQQVRGRSHSQAESNDKHKY